MRTNDFTAAQVQRYLQTHHPYDLPNAHDMALLIQYLTNELKFRREACTCVMRDINQELK